MLTYCTNGLRASGAHISISSDVESVTGQELQLSASIVLAHEGTVRLHVFSWPMQSWQHFCYNAVAT